MLLIVGLGNPGGRYAMNRHNIGFMAVDRIHERHGFPPWRSRFQAEVSERALGGDKVMLMKPMTYMNESGRAVGEAMRFFKLAPSDIVVIHDELDLAPARTRMKVGGGPGGHNGIRSLNAHVGDGYRRLRLGIGHPGNKALVHNYVLHDFPKVDGDWIEPLLDAVADNAGLLVSGEDATFANRLHLALKPDKPARKPPAGPGRAQEPAPSRQPQAEPPEPAPPRSALADGLKKLFGR